LNWKQSLKRLAPAPLLRRRWAKHYWNEWNGAGERELRLLPDFVAAEKRAIDVGGNVGTYTYHLSRLAREVETFEPLPDYGWRIQTLGLRNVRLHACALSDREGMAELRLPAGSENEVGGMGSLEARVVDPSEAGRIERIALRTLDSFAFSDVGFIKIDVEGHEEAVLRGGLELIRRDLPTLLIEIEERHNPGGLARISRMLGELGYQAGFVDPETLQLRPGSDLAAAADGVNNFVFRAHPTA